MNESTFVRKINAERESFYRLFGAMPTEIRFVDEQQMNRLLGDIVPTKSETYSILGMRCVFTHNKDASPDMVTIHP